MATRTENPYSFASLERFKFSQRLIIRVVGLLSYLLVRAIGMTIRFETSGWEHFDSIISAGRQPIYSFWHDRIISSTYFWGGRGIIVLSSTSFDSEYTARCIQRFGFGIVKGSSTRGGVQAMVGMIRLMRDGKAIAFTIDGPKGPRYEAKSGPVLLAKKTGSPLMPFTIECKRFWTLKSWDRLQIPKPFARARVFISDPIYVDPAAGDDELERSRLLLQNALDQLVEQGRNWREAQSSGEAADDSPKLG